MRSTISPKAYRPALSLAAGLALLVTATGCQVDVGGQTLPSPYYMQDDVQYFPAGLEFLLQNEADALRAAREDAGLAPGAARPVVLPQVPPVVPAPAELLPPEAE